jgi:hypothetical protein
MLLIDMRIYYSKYQFTITVKCSFSVIKHLITELYDFYYKIQFCDLNKFQNISFEKKKKKKRYKMLSNCPKALFEWSCIINKTKFFNSKFLYTLKCCSTNSLLSILLWTTLTVNCELLFTCKNYSTNCTHSCELFCDAKINSYYRFKNTSHSLHLRWIDHNTLL